jgi:glycosyltransferase involved in cell wall biosynthesis
LWHETSPIVVREALLSGTPVVAFEIGALPEVIVSGQNRLLVPVGDTDALHDVLYSLSADPNQLARLGDGAIASPNTFKSIKDHVREVDLHYESVMQLAADDRRTRTSLPAQ